MLVEQAAFDRAATLDDLCPEADILGAEHFHKVEPAAREFLVDRGLPGMQFQLKARARLHAPPVAEGASDLSEGQALGKDRALA